MEVEISVEHGKHVVVCDRGACRSWICSSWASREGATGMGENARRHHLESLAHGVDVHHLSRRTNRQRSRRDWECAEQFPSSQARRGRAERRRDACRSVRTDPARSGARAGGGAPARCPLPGCGDNVGHGLLAQANVRWRGGRFARRRGGLVAAPAPPRRIVRLAIIRNLEFLRSAGLAGANRHSLCWRAPRRASTSRSLAQKKIVYNPRYNIVFLLGGSAWRRAGGEARRRPARATPQVSNGE